MALGIAEFAPYGPHRLSRVRVRVRVRVNITGTKKLYYYCKSGLEVLRQS